MTPDLPHEWGLQQFFAGEGTYYTGEFPRDEASFVVSMDGTCANCPCGDTVQTAIAVQARADGLVGTVEYSRYVLSASCGEVLYVCRNVQSIATSPSRP